MSYKLSAEAAAAEAHRSVWRGPQPVEAKSVTTGWPAFSDRQNFTTNQVTVARYTDSLQATAANAAGLSATFSCRELIGGSISTMPCMVYRRVNGVRRVARDHQLYYVLHDSPNFDQSAVDFWEYLVTGIEFQGNAYAEIERRGDGSVLALHPIRPDLVTVRRNKTSGQIEYEWTDDDRRKLRSVAEVLHIRGPMGNALGGVSRLSLCRTVFAGALAAEQAAASTFANGLRPSGTLNMKEKLSSEQRATVVDGLERRFMGAINAGRPMVLDNDTKWEAINITPEDAQMLDSRKFSGEEICRIFGVPPAMVGYGDKASNWGTGKEVDVLGFLKFTLRPRLKRIEAALMKQLLTAADRAQGVTIEFNMEGLLRGDSDGRATFYGKMTQIGAMTINEVRALENLPPVPGGDVPRLQMQNVPIGEKPGLEEE